MSPFAPRALTLTLLLPALALVARAETVRTKDGQELVGEIVEESRDELLLRTRYGVLTIPTAEIEAVTGRAGEGPAPAAAEAAAPSAPPLDLARVRALHLKARRQSQLGQPDKALASYAELLELDPDDATAHLELGALLVKLGRPKDAVASLRRAALAGFVDFERLRRDEALAGLRQDAGFQQLLAQRAGLATLAGRRAFPRLARELRARGAGADYREARDEARKLVWLHALDEAGFAAVRGEAERLLDALRREPFTADPVAPLTVVLLAAADRAVLGDQAATYDADRHLLLLAPLPAGSLLRATAARRQLVRALHAGDQQARQQRHDAWLEEGLVELLGAAALEGEELTPRPSALVKQLEQALTRDAGAAWGGVLGLARPELEKRGRPARLAARYLLGWLAGRDALGRFYQAYAGAPAQGAEAAQAALETALGQPAQELEPAWRAWVAAQTAPALPFTGVLGTGTARGLRVSYVQAESGAAKANLLEGDVISSLDGAPVRSEDDLNELLGACAVGQEVELELLRGDQLLRGRLTLSVRPPGPIGPLRGNAPYLGVAVEQAASGVAVRSVDADSPAAKAGLRPGDVLVSADGVAVDSVRTWLRALRLMQAGQRCKLELARGGEKLTAEVELAPLGD